MFTPARCTALAPLLLLLAACADEVSTPDDAAIGAVDASIDAHVDGGIDAFVDAASQDAASPDSNSGDVEIVDATTGDSDAEVGDAAADDAEVGDAETTDAYVGDASASDAEVSDVCGGDAAAGDAIAGDAAPLDAGPYSCTETPAACLETEVCLGEVCSCVRAIHGIHYLRGDGTVVYAPSGTTTEIHVAGGALLTGVEEIYTGFYHGCALRNDETVWCWATADQGDNSGQLGDGTITNNILPADRFVATPVVTAPSTPLDQVVHLSGGSSRGYLASNTCAVRQDGTLWCWGSPDSSGGGGGTLFNDGVSGPRAYAVEILAAANTSLTGVQAVSLGTRTACLIRNGDSPGEVWCWGSNIGGALGLGVNDQNGRTYPVHVTLLDAPADEIGVGADAACARLGGSLFCWGSNNSGQVGIGAPSAPGNHDGCANYCKTSPSLVLTGANVALDGVAHLDVGYLSVCVTRQDHSLWCWGAGGTAGRVDYATPVELVAGHPLDNVALQTTSGSGGFAQAIRYLNRDNTLWDSTIQVPIVCP